ncbi:hypothetical protein P3S68_017225 [Capsicum galapagoense]
MYFLCLNIPPLLPTIQNRCLNVSQHPFKISSFNAKTISFYESRAYYNGYPPSTRTEWFGAVQLALRTLAYFNFKGYDLLEFARESVVVY